MLIVLRLSNVRYIFFYHLARKLPNLVQWVPLESIAKGEGQTAGLHGAHSMSYDPLMVTKLATHMLTLEIAL